MQHITHGMLDVGGALGRNACRNVFQRGGESEPSAFRGNGDFRRANRLACVRASVPVYCLCANERSFLFSDEESHHERKAFST